MGRDGGTEGVCIRTSSRNKTAVTNTTSRKLALRRAGRAYGYRVSNPLPPWALGVSSTVPAATRALRMMAKLVLMLRRTKALAWNLDSCQAAEGKMCVCVCV